VGLLVLSLVFLLTLALGAALARVVLAALLHIVTTGELPPARAVRVAVFVGALLAFWSLAPAVAASPAASDLMTLLR